MAGAFTQDCWVPGQGQQARSAEHFADPFMDMASLAMPTTIRDAMLWCQHIISANGPYREAIRRIVAYFITDIEVVTHSTQKLGREEKQKYLDFFNDTLGISHVLQTVATDFMVYGNSFTSLRVPFRRYLSCPQCGLEMPLKQVINNPTFGYRWSNFEFNANCPKCHFSGKWRHVDRRSSEPEKLKVRRWDPVEMELLWDPESQDTAYIWKIPETHRRLVKEGHLFHLERASWEVVQAIAKDDQLLLDPETIYHMKEEPLAGLSSYARGWGLSRVLTNFRQAWYLQVLQRYNEAIALDYVIPFRVLTPMPRTGPGDETNDPILSLGMGTFVSRVEGMLNKRKRDPARWNVLPFPLDYKALGGDANALAPKDLQEFALQLLLNSAGIPVELFSGNLSLQSAPAALRLFEATWSHLIHHMNRFLNKLAEKVAQVMTWEPITLRLVKARHADDLNRQMAQLQLMMGGQISKTTGLNSVGIDFNEETRRKLEEERIEAEATEDMQKEMEQSVQMDEMAAPVDPAAMVGGPASGDPTGQPQPGAAPAGAPPGGAPQQMATQQAMSSGFSPHAPITPEEMTQTASNIAAQLMAMPETQKDSQLIALKRKDQVLHSLVRSQMDEMRRAAATQGQQQVLQQQFGKAANWRRGRRVIAGGFPTESVLSE